MKISLPSNSKMHTKEFTFGVATASFQIEGAADTRLPCIWDTFCATASKIRDGSDGKQACEHVALWKDDVQLIESLGVDAYRLSISWPRVIKQDGSLNQQGVDFYVNLIDELNSRGIKVYATLYHWDLPQHIEEQGGWLNRQTAYLFEDYADKITQALGDKVYSYATLNEPFCSSYLGYEVGVHAPGLATKAFGRQSAHHLLLAHGLALKVIQQNCPNALNGIVLNFTPCYPLTDTDADIKAASIADDYFNQWYMKPIMDGEYPAIINDFDEADKPDIQAGDMDIIKQPLDFLGINFYTRAVYSACDKNEFVQVDMKDAPKTDIGWEIYPSAFTDLLTSLNSTYTLPPVYITENGAAMDDKIVNNQVDDLDRLEYYQAHLNAVNDAINQGVNVAGYFAWSLMDNFEWAEGYLKRFGIVYVDYQTQQRTIKRSGLAYREFISQRK
ncbi:GH1 family beta-glucosidase [Shewanella sp. 10N.286.52.B9]|uniref:GH1 family beta-glucosidase n=1 Tax=Shewanella sp. 10N.286.52.B9 TaxID=1880837 RepID=UPI000C81D49E|nr:GH1 family beta-glucosidase [Shewanella sp. 10N.286.52.B9]PMG42876.1 beta-glucosidase [Shewanella sp. 10N.286.52.B9]